MIQPRARCRLRDVKSLAWNMDVSLEDLSTATEAFLRDVGVWLERHAPPEAQSGARALAAAIEILDFSCTRLSSDRGPSPPIGVQVPSDQQESKGSLELAGLVRPLYGHLHWYKNPNYATKLGADFRSKYGSAEILGPGGLLGLPECLMDAEDSVRVGIIAMAPCLTYPRHRHPAHELYVVLSGTADWQVGEDEPTPLPPGSVRYHPSLVPHAMRTRDEATLACYVWWGDCSVCSDLMLDEHNQKDC